MNRPNPTPTSKHPRPPLELDFGVHWRLLEEPNGFSWRVSWSKATGEIYAVELAGFEHRRRLVLATASSREEAERILAGWADRPTVIGPLANRNYFAEQP